MRLPALLLALLPAGGTALAQPAAPPVTLSELRTLSGEALARRLFGPLAPDMFVTPSRNSRPYDLLLAGENVWAWTRPIPADRAGLCRSDRLILHFRTADFARGRDGPMRLHAILGQTYYFVVDRARMMEGGGPPPETMDACRALNPLRAQGIPADNSWQLDRALTLMERLGSEARAGRALAPLDCTHMYWHREQPADEAACLRELRYVGPQTANWVSECRGVPAAAGCIRVLASEMFIEFSLNQGQDPIAITIRGVEDNSAVE